MLFIAIIAAECGKAVSKETKIDILVTPAVTVLVGVGLAVHTGTGTPSAWGIADIAAICPLGGIEAAIASRTIVPPLLIGLAVVVALVALVGRAFCAWGCPVPLLRRGFGVKERTNPGRLSAMVRTIRATGFSVPRCLRRQPSGSRCSASSARWDSR